MEGLCWSRGALGTHLVNMLLLLAVTLLIPSTTHSLSIRNANKPGPSGAGMLEQLILTVELGSQVSFNCTNASSVRFVWYDGVLLLNSSQPLHGVNMIGLGGNNVTIDIRNISSYHYGNYKCFNSDTGQLQTTIILMPSTITVSRSSDLILERFIEQRDDYVLISCGAEELLVKVDSKFRHSVVPGGLLEVNSTDHQGKYLCLGWDNYPVKIYYVQLSGYRPLRVTIRPERIQHSVPLDQNVDCLVTGGPGPFTISWYYNTTRGRPFFTSGRIYVERTGSIDGYDDGLRLILNSSLPELDSGVYICVAKTEWEEAEQSIDVDISSGSEIYIAYWPKTTLAVGGSDINIVCYAVSIAFDTELTFAFRKYNNTLQPGPISRLNNYVTSSSLVLRNVTQSDNGVYICQLLHIVKSDWRSGTLVVYKDPLHVLSFMSNKSIDNSFNLTCYITIHEDFSDRVADIEVVFKLNNQTIAPKLTFTAVNNISAFHMVTDSGLYHCIATIDGVSKSLSVDIKGSRDNKNDPDRLRNILLGAVGVVALLCVIFCVLLFTICCQCPQKLGLAGYSNIVLKTKIGARLSTNSCASADFVFKKSSSKSSLLATSEWAIPYDSLEFDGSLGSGAFGTVRKAYMMTGIGQKTPVAVKTLQCGDDEISSKEAFEKEVMILHRLGSHQHIIGLFGVCVQANRYLLVMELASRGSLLDHLRRKRTDKTHPLRIQEVLKFAEQTALGMEHLVNQQCVHCDLAARNVLITEDFTLKISDFGLSRKLYSGVYVKDRSKKVRLPVRWMAPESMTELKFSSQSDVWSYGVLIWEIYQLGAVPYTGIPAHKLCMLIQQGLRLEKPQNCSEHHYQLMLSCWHDNPSHRPTFTMILQDLSQFITTDSIAYINWNDDDYYSDCSDTSVTSSVENSCPVHGKSSTIKDHPTVKRNVNMKRKDSGLPDSPNEPFACKKDLQSNKSSHLADETDV